MSAPQPLPSEVVDRVRGSPWKATEHAGGRKQVPGSAHPTLQPAGSTTCSTKPARLLLALLLCPGYFFHWPELLAVLHAKSIVLGKKMLGAAQGTWGGNVKFRMEGCTRLFLTPANLLLLLISK